MASTAQLWHLVLYYQLQNERQVSPLDSLHHFPCVLCMMALHFTLLTWIALESPQTLEEIQASLFISVQLLFSGLIRYMQRSSTDWCRKTETNKANMRPCVHFIQCGVLAEGHRESYHETSVADVPRQCGHGPLLWVHNGVLNDISRARHVLWKIALHPARRSARFG